MKKTLVAALTMSALLLGTGLFHAGPAQAAIVTQLDITGGSISLNFGILGSVSGNFTQIGQLVMGQYQPLPHIVPPVTVGGHTFSIFTSNQPFPGNPGGAPVPTGTTSGSTMTVDLRSLFAGVTGPLLNSTLNIGEPTTGSFNAVTNAFDIGWTQPFTGLGVPFLTSGNFSLHGTAQVAAAPVPLPAAVLLFGSGLCGMVGMVVRRQGPFKRQDIGVGSGAQQMEPTRSSAVFLVSSDNAFASDIAEQLRRSGYCLRSIASAAELLEIAQQSPPALILVDRRISDWDVLRTDTGLSCVPIITLAPFEMTATEGDLIEDLERGADGAYSCRDGHRLFLSVIGAYFRRAGYCGSRRGVYHAGAVELDTDVHEVRIGGQRVPLSAKPFALLEAFMRAPSKVYSRSELVDLVWGPNFAIGGHTLDVHIHALRQLLDRDPDHRCRLIAIKGVGFKLTLLQPSIPASLRAEALPKAAAASAMLNSGAVHVRTTQPSIVRLPRRDLRASFRHISRRRRAPSFPRTAIVRHLDSSSLVAHEA
jgi:two-component system response regulator RegX3